MKVDAGSVDELKQFEFDLADSKEACKFDEINRKIGEYVGRVYSKEMKTLIMSGQESTMAKPIYPTAANAMDESKAIWSKEYDQCLKRKNTVTASLWTAGFQDRKYAVQFCPL